MERKIKNNLKQTNRKKKITKKQSGKQMVTFQGLEKEPAVAHNHKIVTCFSPES